MAVTVVFLLGLGWGVFARYLQQGGQHGDSGPVRYSRESVLHLRSHTDTSAHRFEVFPCGMVPDGSSEKK